MRGLSGAMKWQGTEPLFNQFRHKNPNSDRGGPNRGCILVLAKGLSKSGWFPSKPPLMSMVIARHGFPENSVALDPELTLPNHKGLVLLLSVSSLPLRRSGFGASLGMVVEEQYYVWIAGESPVRFLVVLVENDQPVVPGCAEWLLWLFQWLEPFHRPEVEAFGKGSEDSPEEAGVSPKRRSCWPALVFRRDHVLRSHDWQSWPKHLSGSVQQPGARGLPLWRLALRSACPSG